MLEENKKLVKDVANRLGAAVQDLRELLVRMAPSPAPLVKIELMR